jgi:UDP-N-acetylglucosamine 2-epimerase (non-hydrolysing)
VLDELKLVKDGYFLVSAHREENVDSLENLGDLVESLNAVADIYQMPIMFSTHPRTLKRLGQSSLKLHSLIQVHKPFNFSDYNHLQMNAKAVLSDSGTISEETSILKFKALNIRTSQERPEAMEEGTVMMVGLNKENILRGIDILEQQTPSRIVKDYEFSSVSNTVLTTIVSYTSYINQKIWKKYS